MTQPYTLVENLSDLVVEISPESIVSRTFYRGEELKAILFGFDTGQELSEHTASQTAIIQIIQGEATITLGEDTYEAQTGFWVVMPPQLKHSVYAKTRVLMLLLMVNA